MVVVESFRRKEWKDLKQCVPASSTNPVYKFVETTSEDGAKGPSPSFPVYISLSEECDLLLKSQGTAKRLANTIVWSCDC